MNYEVVEEIAKRYNSIKAVAAVELGMRGMEYVSIIAEALENKVNILPFVEGFSSAQLSQIMYGLINNVDVSIYAEKHFNEDKMREIRLGLESGVDVSLYAKKRFGHKQMQSIRIDLQQGKPIGDIFYLN